MAGKKERGTHIGLHEFVVVLSAGLDEWFVVPNPGVVQQDMQRSEVLFCCLHGAQGRLLLTHIPDHCYSSTTCGVDHLYQLVETGLPTRDQDKTCSFSGQRQSGRFAYPCTGSRNQTNGPN